MASTGAMTPLGVPDVGYDRCNRFSLRTDAGARCRAGLLMCVSVSAVRSALC